MIVFDANFAGKSFVGSTNDNSLANLLKKESISENIGVTLQPLSIF